MKLLRRHRFPGVPRWKPPKGEYVPLVDNGDVIAEGLNGLWWYEAEIPPVNHRCYPQVRGWHGMYQVFRCACGGIRDPLLFDTYANRNSRTDST